MQFIVTTQQLDGSDRILLMDAESQEELYAKPGLTDAIKSVWEVPFGLKLGSTKLKLEEQLLLVAQIATLVDSGASIPRGIRDIAQASPFLNKQMLDPRMEHVTLISDYLDIFGVNENVKLLVRSGEESGRLSEAVNMAVETIEQDIELRKATGADLKLGLTYMVAGILSVLILSLILGGPQGPARQIVDIPQLRANTATHILIAIHDTIVEDLLFTIPILIGLGISIRYLWEEVPNFKKIWGIKQLDDLLKARRSANFLSAWTPLFTSGMSPDKALRLIAKSNRGANRRAVESIRDGVEQGATIPKSLTEQFWSPSFIVGMMAFDAAHDEARRNLLVRIKRMLITEIFVTGKRFSKLALWIGMGSAIITVLLIAAGFYAPMLLSRGG